MGEKTGIEWTDHTFNPWWGCTKISEACVNCYAQVQAARFSADCFGDNQRWFFRDKHWAEPLKWNKAARRDGVRRKVFCGSMCDVFENRPEFRVPRARLWQLIACTPSLDWLLLTKRPEHAKAWFDRWADLSGETDEPKLARGPDATRAAHPSGRGQIFADMLESMGNPPPGCAFPTFDWMEGPRWWPDTLLNVWIGTTVENQARADERIPTLLAIPAARRFLSCEPLLGPVDIEDYLMEFTDHEMSSLSPIRPRRLHWVIAGGESGPGARPSHPDWFRGLRDQCQAAGVPFFFKQWGEWAPAVRGDDAVIHPEGWVQPSPEASYLHAPGSAKSPNTLEKEGFAYMHRVGKKAAGCLLDGREHKAFPSC